MFSTKLERVIYFFPRSLAADVILFNSAYNQETFLSSIKSFFNLMPDYRPGSELVEEIKPKCEVLHFPICFPRQDLYDRGRAAKDGPLHIVWAHRWLVCFYSFVVVFTIRQTLPRHVAYPQARLESM